MSVVSDVLQRVRVRVAQRRLRLNDFFADFDKLRSGRITAEQLRRVLAVNNVQLSEEEFHALIEHFAAPLVKQATNKPAPYGASTLVSYVNFLNALQAEDPPAELLTTLGRKPNVLSDEEEKQLESAMRSIRDTIRGRGLYVRGRFEDFDRFHSGKVNASVFRRCIPIEALREEVLRLIIKKYSNEDGDVLYSAWCDDLSDSREESPLQSTRLPLVCTAPKSKFSTVEDLLRMLREQFSMYRLRCDDYLRDYDRFRTGYVTAPQFESALGQLRLVDVQLTSEHISALTRAYAEGVWEGTGNGTNDDVFPRVNYVQFLADTDPGTHGDESKAKSYFEDVRAPGQFLDAADEEEQRRAEMVLQKVRRLISSNRVYLVPTMHDFDRVRKGIYEHRTCTTSRFARSLATHKVFLSPEEIALLVKRYAVRAPDGSRGDEVNYYQFVMDVDDDRTRNVAPGRTVQSKALEELQRQAKETRMPPADTVPAVLAKLALQASDRHLRINEFFIDFDPLRSGIVQTEKFVVALGIAGVRLQPQEMDILTNEYKSLKVPGHIDVARFISELGEVAPSAVPTVATRFNFTASLSSAGLAAVTLKDSTTRLHEKFTKEELDEVQRLLARLAHDVSSRQVLLMPFFSDFDRFRRAKIPKTSFLKALSRHRFVLTPSETKILTRYYASLEDSELIEYRRFVRDVDPGEAVGDVRQETANGSSASAAEGAATASAMNAAAALNTNTNTIAATVTADGEDIVEHTLGKVCAFLREREPRLSEFFPDGDELRHQHVSNSRFRHCLSMIGLDLTEKEFSSLESAFAHSELRGHVNYPAFISVVSRMMGDNGNCETTLPYRSGSAAAAAEASNVVMEMMEGEKEMLTSALDKVRRTLASRRSTSLPAFRQYDRSRKGFVKEGQFFAVLMSLGVQLSPAQSDVLRKAYSMGGGEMCYLKFTQTVDDARFE
ncbi:hypothetical protein ERJ75_000188600 [Trypanosoma vivax]|nr:hypothetical protein ERJ75_000188600 [Trypanosoma vivax]